MQLSFFFFALFSKFSVSWQIICELYSERRKYGSRNCTIHNSNGIECRSSGYLFCSSIVRTISSFKVEDERRFIETYSQEQMVAVVSHFKFMAGMNVGKGAGVNWAPVTIL